MTDPTETAPETKRRVRTPSPGQLRAIAQHLRTLAATDNSPLFVEAATDTADYLDHVAGKAR